MSGISADGVRHRKAKGPITSFPVEEIQESPRQVADDQSDLAPAHTAVKRTPRRRIERDDDKITWSDLVAPIIGVSIVVALVTTVAFLAPALEAPEALKHIGGKKLKWIQQFQGRYRDVMLWGTYRPGYYWGARYRMPHTLSAGLMWFDPTSPDGLDKLRHEARQEDGLDRYGWLEHDAYSYGKQELLDNGYNITTTWVNRFHNDNRQRGGDWTLNIKVNAYDPADVFPERKKEGYEPPPPRPISVVFYLHDEMAPDWRGYNAKVLPNGPLGFKGGLLMASNSFPLDGWHLYVRDNNGQGLSDFHYRGELTTDLVGMSSIVKSNMELVTLRKPGQAGGKQQFQLTDSEHQKKISTGIFQFTSALPLDIDITFVSGVEDPSLLEFKDKVRRKIQRFVKYLRTRGMDPSAALGLDYDAAVEAAAAQESLLERVNNLQGPACTDYAAVKSTAWHDQFADILSAEAAQNLPEGAVPALQAGLANLVGGIGFFYGSSKVLYTKKDSDEVKEGELKPMGLFTSVPSRSFFPRGFLWDEGFHLLLIDLWSPQISRDIIAHWLDLLTAEGWIPREQILGPEAEARVPSEFIVQNPLHANPPTLFLALVNTTEFVRKHIEARDMPRDSFQWNAGEFLSAAFYRLRAWFLWYHKTQKGPLTGSYRWRGRNETITNELNPKTMASGLDDYPRASHPSAHDRHLDLRCWMAVAGKTLVTIGRMIGWDAVEVDELEAIVGPLLDVEALNKLHWDAKSEMYLDYGMHTEKVRLERIYYRDPHTEQPIPGPMQRNVKGSPKLQFVPQFGYVSLFPMMLKLLPPTAPQLEATLRHMRNPDHLWTEYGLRSLSKSASLYDKRNTEHDPPYWRSPIWININYLACSGLHHYANTAGPFQQLAADIYRELRSNLIGNVVQQYQRTGYLWENYNDKDGKGQFSHPFTGWTSLILLIAAEKYI